MSCKPLNRTPWFSSSVYAGKWFSPGVYAGIRRRVDAAAKRFLLIVSLIVAVLPAAAWSSDGAIRRRARMFSRRRYGGVPGVPPGAKRLRLRPQAALWRRVDAAAKLLILLIITILPTMVWAADGALRFRRVYAPADRLKDWPLGEARYMRMDPAEFERRLAAAQTEIPGARALVATRVVGAQYQARLVGDRLTGGQATLQVIHAAEDRVLLPLDPCGLAIGRANWAADGPRPATLELGTDGKLAVLVERSGRLDFEWSLAGHRDTAEAINFQLELPICPTNRLILDLPEDMTPVTDCRSIVEPGRTAGTAAGLRRWQIELGGHHRCRLRVAPAGAARQRRQLALVRESVVYDFSLSGVEVSAQLNLEVHNRPLEQVAVMLDGQLQLVAARFGDVPVRWSVTSAADRPATRVVLTLPEPIQDTEGVLRLRALAPLQVDRRWRLPRIRPEKLFWQEGSATLSVPVPLVLSRLEPIDCRQSDTGPLSAPRVGESAKFQFFAPDATVEITLSRRHVPVQLSSGTSVELAGGELTARVAADFRIAESSRFSFEADVARQWLIDSVESRPPEALHDWSLDEQPDGDQKLTVRLARALTPDRPLRILIAARRLHSPLGQKLGIDDLVPLRFRVAHDGSKPAPGKRLVAVRAVGPYQLELSGAEGLNRVDPQGLDAAGQELFAEPPQGLLLNDDSGAADLRIALVRQKPSYTGTLRAEATVTDTTLREEYVVRCVPESARVDRLLAQFTHRRDVPLHWTLGTEDDRQLSARQLSTEEQAAVGLDLEGEAWELTLRRPRSVPFEIRAGREVARAEKEPVSLVWLPDAAGQRATLVIRSLGPKAVQIKNHRLRPIHAETVPLDRYQPAQATYCYDPPGDTAPAAGPAVTISTLSGAAMPSAWVWNCHVESRYEANGAGRHLATYRIQSSGGRSIQLELPAAVTTEDVRDVRVDENRITSWGGSSTAAPTETEDARSLTIGLPSGAKFPTVSIHFATSAPRLGIVGSLEPPLPVADLPVLSQYWTVWLPPGYETFDADLHRQLGRAPQPGSVPLLRQKQCCENFRENTASGEAVAHHGEKCGLGFIRRLFGPLGRLPGRPAFDPLVAETWFPAGSEPADTCGWTAYRMETSAAMPGRLKFAHRRTMQLFGSVSFLLVVAVGWWKLKGRPKLLTVLLGLFGVAVLVLPEAYVPIASGAVLAAAFCLLFRLIRRRKTAIQLGIMATATAAISAVCATGLGQEETHRTKSGPAAPPVSRVFIPIDEQGKPTGGKYYVPGELYRQLYRRSVHFDKEAARWVADLDPSNHLTVRRTDGTGPGGAGPAVDVEELLWLKVHPGSVVLDAKFKFKIIEGRLRQLRLVTDPRLRLLPLPGDEPPLVDVRTVPGQPQTIWLRWPRPLSETVVVEARFLLMGTSGLGNLRLPQLEVPDARSTRRWMAVSIDPALDHQQQTPARLQPVAVPDFISAWGDTAAQPLFAYRLGGGATDWSMSTRPREPCTTVEQTLALGFGRECVEVRFDAQLVTTSGYNFQHRLVGPAALEVERVSVLEEKAERAARFSQDEDGTVTVFLTGPVAGRQKLSLRGRLPSAVEREMSLPLLQIDATRLKSSRIELFRRPSVLVEVNQTSGLAELSDPTAGQSRPELGRLVRCFRAQGDEPVEATVTVVPNRPKVHAEQVAAEQVAAEPCRAILRPPDPSGYAARVRLADVRIAFSADGSCRGTAAFDLLPGKSSQCPLWLPLGCHLVQVSVAGAPAAPIPAGPGAWLLPLGPERLPQRIEVIFGGTLPEPPSAAVQRFDAPTLGELPVARTLWTVVGPPLYQPGEPEGAASTSPWRHELYRLKNTAALIEAAAKAPAEDPAETLRWYRLWARRLITSRTALRRQLARVGPTKQTRAAGKEIHAIDKRQSQIARRLGMTGVLAQLLAQAPVADEPSELWQWSLDRPPSATRCSFTDGISSITLTYRRAEGGWGRGGLASAIGFGALVGLVLLGLRRGTLAEWFKRWPHAIGVAVGLAWWLWLSPSILGWSIVLLSLVAALRSGWKRSPPVPGSSIIAVRSVQR